MRVIVLSDHVRLAQFAADHLADRLENTGAERTNLALSGGGTPIATYEALRLRPIRWKRVDLWMGDERWVPYHHEDSNTRMIQASLADHVPARFHPVPWNEAMGPEEAAHRYALTLGSFLEREDDHLAPEVALLGIGHDGHTASLFPGTPALDVTDQPYVGQYVHDKDGWRLTATLPLLHATRHLVFLVQGEKKAGALHEILEGDGPPLPAQRVAEGGADVTWLLDEEAASQLRTITPERP